MKYLQNSVTWAAVLPSSLVVWLDKSHCLTSAIEVTLGKATGRRTLLGNGVTYYYEAAKLQIDHDISNK